MNWGVEILEYGFVGSTAVCWRCLMKPVPGDDDHIGLCDACIADLRAPESAG